jgi:hypothetical protein
LPVKPAGQRDAGEGQQEEREHRPAAASAWPGPAHWDRWVRLAAASRDQRHDGERADGREAVGEQVEQHARGRRARPSAARSVATTPDEEKPACAIEE